MADDFLHYDEDYEQVSDWDESESDHGTKKEAEKSSKSNDKSEQGNNGKSNTNGTKAKEDTESKMKDNKDEYKKEVFSKNRSNVVESKDTGFKYEILTNVDILTKLNEIVDSLSNTLNIENEIVSLLLRKLEWKPDKLLELFMADSVKTMRRFNCHLCDLCDISGKDGNQDNLECEMCLNDVSLSKTIGLKCDKNHRYCHSCWYDYIVNGINNKSIGCVNMTCPGYNCATPIKDIIIKNILLNEKEKGSIYWKKFENFLVESYIDSFNSQFKHCPKAGCDLIVHSIDNSDNNNNNKFVTCKCGYSFCFNCSEEYHAPALCDQVFDWKLKCGKESDNAQWIVTNTKKCPKCFTRIEKNHGCNHMICYKCQFEFCWVCLGSWKEHGIGTGGFYRCNKYKPKQQLGNKMKLQSSKDEELDKFVHYYNRFHNHAQSRLFLSQNSHKVIEKIKQHLSIDPNNQGWIDVEFLQKSHQEIFFCRQVLKYTYVFAYYLENGKEKDLFEFLQQDLEKNCEILHELSEQSGKNLDKASILKFTNITHQFVTQLLDGVRKGLI